MAYRVDGVGVIPVRVPVVSTGPSPHISTCPLSLLSVSPLLHLVITLCSSLSEPNPSFARLPIPQMFKESYVVSLLRWAGRIDRLDPSGSLQSSVCLFGNIKSGLWNNSRLWFIMHEFLWSDYPILENLCCCDSQPDAWVSSCCQGLSQLSARSCGWKMADRSL